MNNAEVKEQKPIGTTNDVVVSETNAQVAENATETSGDNTTQNETTTAAEKDSATKEETVAASTTDEEDKKETPNPLENITLNYLDPTFVLDCMSIPTHSGLEQRMVVFIILWCRRNNIKYEFDKYGNIYLTKGELGEGEYYPCVTSHLDTVHREHDPYIKAGVPLDLKIEVTTDKEHKVSVLSTNGSIGIGADDKGGIAICLSIFEHFDKLKACFFLEEETGCKGSKNLWKEWFDNVGYVIGYDSPELYRSAYACNGTNLFSYEFYEKYMKDICDSWGLTKGHFHSEPFTDVKEIREQVGVICMNFGNGGYNPHSSTEYCILEHMDYACGMGIDLIQNIGLTRHYLKHRDKWDKTGTYIRTEKGFFIRKNANEDELLATLSDRKSYNTTTYNTNRTTTLTVDEQLKMEVLKYVINRYDKYIRNTSEDVMNVVKNVCEENNIDFSLFEGKLKEQLQEEITF